MFSRARWRLALWFTAVVAVIVVVIGVAVFATARAALFDQVNHDLSVRAERTNQLIAEIRGGRQPRDLFGPAFTTGGYFYALYRDDGALIGSTDNIEANGIVQPTDIQQASSNGARFVDTSSQDGEHLRLYLIPVNRSSSPVLAVGRSTEPERSAVGRLLLILAGGGAGALVLAIVGGFLLAGRALRPIKTAMDKQQEFVADASHELRTPLALIRANAEILKRESEKPVSQNLESVQDIIQETDRLSSLVGQMLMLARADAGQATTQFTQLDVSGLAADAVREMRLLAGDKSISIGFRGNGALPVRGDPNRLRELLTILIDNSIKYSDPGAAVDVSVQPAGEKAVIQVSDNGRGIAHSALPRIFERFYRADKARSRGMGGTGLGLAIAKWIVDSHGGTIAVDSEPGRGTAVTIELPRAAT